MIIMWLNAVMIWLQYIFVLQGKICTVRLKQNVGHV